MKIGSRLFGVLAAGALLVSASPASAQRYFGQNQVKYRYFRWRVLETEHFLIHYYPEEQLPVHDAARMAERSYSRLSRLLGHQFREKKPILLYASREDFGQSNINGDLGEGVSGVTEPMRQRIELPFTGDYDFFEHVLTHEMVHQFQFDVFAQGKAGQNLQTLEQVNPPGWYMEGMAEYLSQGPNDPLTTMWIRNAVQNGGMPTIKQMTDDPDKYFVYRYGEALWRYVGERWGDAAIGEILQSTTTMGVDRAFEKELGLTMGQLSDQWRAALREQYLPQLATMQRVRDIASPLLTPKITGGSIFISPVLSPDGKTIAFFSNGSFKKGEVFIDLYLGDALTGKRLKRLVATTTNARFEELRLLYAQGSFSPDSKEFAFTAQTEGRDVLSIADVATGKVVQYDKIPLDGVLNPSYSPDGKHIVFSGFAQGLTDLYVIDADGKNLRHLTQDRYSDLMPRWSPDGTRIAYATDRASTNLADLNLGKLQIAIYDLQNGTSQVLPDQPGLNINPVWSPDGKSIAYVSDRNGTANIYLRDLATNVDSRVTNLQSGASAITATSPVMSWSPGTDRLAFTYFDNNDYTVWYIDHPRQFATAIVPESTTVASTAAIAAPTSPVHDSTPGRTSAGVSTYRSLNGARRSGTVTVAETADSTNVSSVATLLADPITGLPDTLTFKDYPYRVSFQPDYISGGTIGVATGGGYGTQFGGGTTLVFSDLTGDHQIAVGGGVSGRIQDASVLFDYANLSHRWQYITGISQDVAYLNTGIAQSPDGSVTQLQFLRYVIRSASLTGEYPLNRFQRFELGLGASAIGRGFVTQTYDLNSGFSQSNGQSFPTLSFLSPSAAYVTDNSLFGVTGPVSGRRMRFAVSPAIGSLQFTNYTIDYRRYDPIVFDALTFATRAFFNGSYGRDANELPIYVGQPSFVRGYDQSSFYGGYSCSSFLGTSSQYANGCAAPQLIGTRAIVLNEELRFPIIRRFDLGALPIGIPPVDGALFYDAGLAWSAGQTPHIFKPANYDSTKDVDRYFLRSYGATIRVNLFNIAVLNWSLARPLDRPGYHRFNWTFALGVGY
ncbi:MAG TPA: DPP IV N-terminal domain-containing protein [Gemmatimonadaceae bacterium]